MIAVAIVRVDQASTRPTGFGAAMTQWHTVLAVDANGKLNDHAEMVNGRRSYSGRMNSWTSAIIASTPPRPVPTVVIRLSFNAIQAMLAVAGGTIKTANVGKRAEAFFGHQAAHNQGAEHHPEEDAERERSLSEVMPAVSLQRNTGKERPGDDW
jgi:hypothetical protein